MSLWNPSLHQASVACSLGALPGWGLLHAVALGQQWYFEVNHMAWRPWVAAYIPCMYGTSTRLSGCEGTVGNWAGLGTTSDSHGEAQVRPKMAELMG